MDYGTPVTSDEEWEAKEDGMVTDSKEDVAVADFENMEAPSSPPRKGIVALAITFPGFI